jgi:BirA family biotin operon repressor/biotin-[acetyl-CoA-carboxylase] ligase
MRPPPLSRAAVGSRVIRLSNLPSTNNRAKELARSGAAHGTVVVAAEQTAGRGQRSRRWASPPGGLWASVLVRPREVPATRAGLLGIAAAAASAEAASALSGVAVKVKWPNDLLLSGRKVGGVLVETSIGGSNIAWAVVGIGINANFGVEALPPRLRRSATTLLHETGREIPLDRLLSDICGRLEEFVGTIERGQIDQLLARWCALDTTPGREVRASNGAWAGAASGIDPTGQLLINTGDGRRVTVSTSAGISIA